MMWMLMLMVVVMLMLITQMVLVIIWLAIIPRAMMTMKRRERRGIREAKKTSRDTSWVVEHRQVTEVC